MIAEVLNKVETVTLPRCKKPKKIHSVDDVLTPQQKRVLIGVAHGHPNHAIASEMGLSVKTVEKHRQAVHERTGIHCIAGLVHWAIRHKVVEVQNFGITVPA